MKSEQIKEELAEAVEIARELDNHLDETFKFNGKTRQQWRAQLMVTFPEDELTFADIIRLGAKLANNYQIAARYRDNQRLTIDTLTRTRADTYRQAYIETLDKHKKDTGKALAAASCDVKASAAVAHIDSVISAKTIIRDFWKNTCDSLTEARKNLEVVAQAAGNESFAGRDFVVKVKEKK